MESTIANVDLGRYRRFVQMVWDPQPSNDVPRDQPAWILGRSYRLREEQANEAISKGISITGNTQHNGTNHRPDVSPTDLVVDSSSASRPSGSSPRSAHEDLGRDGCWPNTFLKDFESRFWMTYRSDFLPIQRSHDPKALSALSLSMRIKSQLSGDQTGFSSDSGWGCMIRSGQSLLANALGTLNLGRDWRRGDQPEQEKDILRMFADDPRAPYSIHNFVGHGATACGKYPGEWFGPSATARCIQALANDLAKPLRVYSTGDGPDIYEDSFMRIARPDGETFHPTLILVGTRLGIDKITPVYWEALIASLQMPQSVGIAGGRPSSSHYFVGAQGWFLFYLDPHFTRKALPFHSNASEYTDEEIGSCHTSRLRRIHIREIDPSMLIGFLIQSQEDWTEWRRCVNHVQGKAIIHVSDYDPTITGGGNDCRAGAIDEVETISDDDEDQIVSG